MRHSRSSLAVVTLLGAVAFTCFILHRCRLLHVSRLFSDSWWLLILTLPLAIGIVASVFSANQNAGIASHETATDGVILDCQPSNLCRFSFASFGHSFEGAGTAGAGTATVGHKVTVFFDTNHPQTNSLEDFATTSRRQLVMVPCCLLLISLVVGTAIYAARVQSKLASCGLSA